MVNNDDIKLIRKISLFSTLNDEQFEQLFRHSYLQSFPKHTQLLNEGDTADFLHVLVDGIVELFGSSNERETTMFIMRPVSTFNLSAVLEDAYYLMSARTLERSRVLMIPSVDVRHAMQACPGFTHNLAIELASRYRAVINSFMELKLRDGVERLANYLLRANRQLKKGGQIVLTEDRRTLAALLGITPEYLSRALKKLRDYGVEAKGNQITLSDIGRLKRIAKPNPLIDSREV